MGSIEAAIPESEIIYPPFALTPEIVTLAPSDQFIIRNFVTTILFFKNDEKVAIQETISSLKQGLANALAELPFLAGTVVAENPQKCTLQVDIQEGAGVEFRVNDMRHLSGKPLYDYQALEAAGFPPSALDFNVLVCGTLIPPPEPVCLTIQANFIHGGLLLAVHLHHAVMDGSGLFTFFQCLSKHTAAASRSQIVQPKDLLPDDALDRFALQSNPTCRQMIEYPGFRPATEDSWAAKADAGKLMARLVTQSETEILKQVIKSWWIMSPKQLQSLQEEKMTVGADKVKPTMNSTISALCWRHISLARRLPQTEFEYSGLTTVCDFRARLDPPLNSDYAGNALVFARARVPVKDICSDEPDVLHRISTRITESVDWWDSDKIQGLLDAVDSTDMGSVEWDCDSHFGPDVQVTSTLGAVSPYSLDWGLQLGQMQALRFPTGAFYDGFVTVLPRLPDGSIEFVLNGGAEVLTRLKADKEFTRYARFLCC